jgi:hypothetical protein
LLDKAHIDSQGPLEDPLTQSRWRMAEPEIQRGVELYLAYFQEARRLHLHELGRELELYKDTEPRCVEQTLERLITSRQTGTAFIAEILHELAWSQCLGNANHRTAILFTGDFLATNLGDDFEGPHFAHTTDRWIISSQAIIRRRGEWGYNQAGLEDRHKEITMDWIGNTLEGQSEALMMIGPNRLLNFLSGISSSSGRGR